MCPGIGTGERVSLTAVRNEVFEAPILPFGLNEAVDGFILRLLRCAVSHLVKKLIFITASA